MNKSIACATHVGLQVMVKLKPLMTHVGLQAMRKCKSHTTHVGLQVIGKLKPLMTHVGGQAMKNPGNAQFTRDTCRRASHAGEQATRKLHSKTSRTQHVMESESRRSASYAFKDNVMDSELYMTRAGERVAPHVGWKVSGHVLETPLLDITIMFKLTMHAPIWKQWTQAQRELLHVYSVG